MWPLWENKLENKSSKLHERVIRNYHIASQKTSAAFRTWGKEFRIAEFLGGVTVGICLSTLFTQFIWPYRHITHVWIYSSRFRKHWKAGMSCRSDVVLQRDGYAVGYSYLYRSPLWVSYIACRSSIGVNLPIEGVNFMVDTELPKCYQASPTDYLLSGYDRGHMAPCGTINFSHRSNDQTMLLSNICLQHPELNRNGWKSIEGNIRKWITLRGKHAVVVGPVWDAERTKKVNSIGIPKAFFLAVYSYSTGETIGFHVPNKPVAAKDIWNYVVNIDELERITKLKIFRKLPFFRRPLKHRRRKVSMEFWRKE
ncbi:chaperone protein DNAj [Perkinsela sp. CCAP 1560/4]|nr:chaperone protein DNAj [Perkinsela sp. CCAP 1560/4]|eukprot:KNH09376.1 chaperone protein DNAj [Perkinsela sp. CCAP 1560/4]